MIIKIFDIDGTLTHAYGDIADKTGYETYAFWPLITAHFTKDKDVLNKMIADWEESMNTEKDPTGSSHDMMQKGINTFRSDANGAAVRAFAKGVTLKFIEQGVIRKEAIAYLEKQAKQGVICILSTGSYQDGALGFVDALVEKGLISKETQKALYVSGAVVDWDSFTLLHANVRERKLLGIEAVTGRKISELQQHIKAVYGDDPWINDKDILEIAPPGVAYVITTCKNNNKELPSGYSLTTWNNIIKQESKETEEADRNPVTTPFRSML